MHKRQFPAKAASKVLESRFVTWRQPSERVQELIRRGAWLALNPTKEWLEEFDRVTLGASDPIARDPGLAAVVTRSNRVNLVYFASAMLQTPGAPVEPSLNAETTRMARDLVRRGLDASALEVYRIGHNLAWRRWTEIAFELTSDPEELRELLDVPFRSANEYVDGMLASIATQMQAEYDSLAKDVNAECRKIVDLILAGAPISRDSAEDRLGYTFDCAHTAAIIWADEPGDDPSPLDRAVEAFREAVGNQRPLVVAASGGTRWVWARDVGTLDPDTFRDVLDQTGTHLAIGAPATGVEGFRRSHTDALTTQRMMARLRSRQRVAFFAEIQMIALLTENLDGSDEFIRDTLGDFESATKTLQQTVLTYVTTACNASRAAKILYTHRNTLLHRLEAAQKLLPRPIEDNPVDVAVALRTLQWRGPKTIDPADASADRQSAAE